MALSRQGNPKPKVKCKSLWKVYGPNVEHVLSRYGTLDDKRRALFDLVETPGHIGAVQDVDFEVQEGEIFIIMGLSGSGKSTLVRCVSRLIETTCGEIDFDGTSLLETSAQELIRLRRHKMGMVFQNFGLMPHLSVLDNVAFPLRIQGCDLKESERRAQEMVVLVGLEGRESARPDQLSGGQQQRVGIARSLVTEPELWFLDEPFSALDPLIRAQIQDEFLRLQEKLNKTIIFITHDFQEAMRLGDRIAIMRDGKIIQIGTPHDIVMRPVDDYVARFAADVPRLRVLTAMDCIEQGTPPAPPEFSVDADEVLEGILPRLAQVDQIAVTRDGQPLGFMSSTSVVRALVAPVETGAE